MKSLKTYITEEKNTHMEHLEDLVFNEGVAGTRKAINFLRDLRDMLSGNSTQKVQTTVKWDGAPAIFVGIDPSDGKFFVAKKGVFNKNPKVYKTPADVRADTTGDLQAKLLIALSEFSKLGITSGVYQGDLMFTKKDLKTTRIQGQSYTTFHPNTIVYAVPSGSTLAAKIKRANIGVVWHTAYTGTSFETMRAAFGQDIVKKFKKTPTVWQDDANYKDVSGTATFTAQETAEVTAVLSEAGKLFQGLNAKMINDISADNDLLTHIKTFNNTKVRAGEQISNPTNHVKEMFHWIADKYQAKIDSMKTEKGKAGWEEKKKEVMKYFVAHDQAEIAKIFQLTNLLVKAKSMIIKKMNQAGEMKTFLRTTSGYRVTDVEGFVAIDRLTGNAVKIVDRMEFSRSNFSPDIIKGWQK